MKYKYISLEFENDLNQRQEKILYESLEAIKEKILKEINQTKKNLSNNIINKLLFFNTGKITKDALNLKLIEIERNIDKYIVIEKINSKNYRYLFASENIKFLLKKGIFNFNENSEMERFIDGLKRFIFPEMKIYPKKITTGEIEIEN